MHTVQSKNAERRTIERLVGTSAILHFQWKFTMFLIKELLISYLKESELTEWLLPVIFYYCHYICFAVYNSILCVFIDAFSQTIRRIFNSTFQKTDRLWKNNCNCFYFLQSFLIIAFPRSGKSTIIYPCPARS